MNQADVIQQSMEILFKYPPQSKRRQLKFVEWQTWPFNQNQPKIGFSHGVCEADDFHTFIRPTLKTVGQLPYWREISIAKM
jgi:hypothetical protein